MFQEQGKFRLFPFGKSGLKSALLGKIPFRRRSLPVWEEWIEIAIAILRDGHLGMSLPVWEEWIEIDGRRYPNRTNVGLFPYGKSGLKWHKGIVI